MSMEFVAALVRNAALAASIGAVGALCASASVRRGEGGAGAGVRLIATLLAPATALAFVGLFWWPLSLGVSVIAAFWQGRGSLHLLIDRVREIWATLSLVSKVALFTLVVGVTFRSGGALSIPPADGDSLLYHLPMTAALLQDHSMWFTRASLYAGATELGEAVGAATTGNVNGIVAFELIQLVALGLVAFGWARRAGARLDGAAATAIVAGSFPMVTDQMFTSQNDIFVCTMLAAGCTLWRQAPRLAAVAFGLLFAAKVTAFLLVPAVAAVMLAFEGWPFAASDLAVGAALAAPWYARTWILSGSPLYTVSSLGYSSTIAANLNRSWPFILTALRNFGGLAAILGLPALLAFQLGKNRPPFTRTMPWLALAVFAVWIFLPNSAESVPGALDQIRNGWSIRYAMFLPLLLAMALPIVLDNVTSLPLAAFIALVASASAVVRSANVTASLQALGFVYALPIALTAACALLACSRRPAIRVTGAVCALAIWSLTATAGAQSIQRLWDPTYLQWSHRIPENDVILAPLVRNSAQVAVLGMRSFPLVGPYFARRTYEDIVVRPRSTWLDQLRQSTVPVLVASGESGSPVERDFMRTLQQEVDIARAPGVCLLATYSTARIYGLDPHNCIRTSGAKRRR